MAFIELFQVITRPVDDVYNLVSDMESYPKFMKNIVSVRVLERIYGRTVTSWITEVDEITLMWQEVDEYFPEEWSIHYRQVKGDMEHYEGWWILQPIPEGTRLCLKMDFELGIPMVSGMIQYLLINKVKKSCRDMLKWIKEKAEKQEYP